MGVGAIVLRRGCVLMVERGGSRSRATGRCRAGCWKRVSVLEDGVRREVVEETGIE